MQKLTSRNRKEIKAKMASAFSGEIESLSKEYRGILLDDLITAFESRFSILSRVRSNGLQLYVEDNKEFTLCANLKSRV
jgi:hypothetical protein